MGPRLDMFARGASRTLAFMIFLMTAAGAMAPLGSQTRESPARAEVEQLIRASGAEIGVAFQLLDRAQELFLDADKPFHAASTMKVPVMIELFAEAGDKKLSVEDKIPVKNEFKSLADGSPYHLNASDDSDNDVYKAIGTSWTLRQLCEAMITRSSNLAANLLIERLGVENIRARVHSLGADGMQVLRGVEDEKAFQKGMNNTTTARGLLILLKAIAENRAGDADSCKQMREMLERQTFNEAIPAGLPSGILVAHKTGEITGVHHDAAIVYAAKPFVLVILVKGIEDRDKSSLLMASITRAIYRDSQR
ncbi:MAG TPA: serine hydrolase [Candidatus Acidoferrales bacterium]|nr:serine hydrolase [Candidatus Acidoferrales bacterium]